MDFYKYVRHTMRVGQGSFEVLEAGDTALVIMESTLDYVDPNGAPVHALRRATYVFKRAAGGSWLCAIDNSYGTALLDA
jgi:ketosteroid isomerase-like protein